MGDPLKCVMYLPQKIAVNNGAQERTTSNSFLREQSHILLYSFIFAPNQISLSRPQIYLSLEFLLILINKKIVVVVCNFIFSSSNL